MRVAVRLFCCVIIMSIIPPFPGASVVLAGPVAVGAASFQKGLQFRKQGKLTEAESYLVKALTVNPANPDYHFELANVYALWHDKRQKRRDASGAIEKLMASERELQHVLMSRPDYIPARYNLAVVLKRLGNYEQAREEFKKIVRIGEKTQDAYIQLNALMQIGGIYEEQGFFDDAVDYYQMARERDYYNPDILNAIKNAKTAREQNLEPRPDFSDLASRVYARNAFRYAPGSQAGKYQTLMSESARHGQGLAPILPFLGMMLAQQFMQARGDSGGDDDE